MWLTNDTQTATITFDLGSVQTINQLVIWNYNERTYNQANNTDYSYRGVKNFSLLADNTPNPTSLIGAYTLARNTMPLATTFAGINDYGMDNTGTAQTIDLSSPVTARYFAFAVTSSHTTTLDNYTCLSEVRFDTIPETSSVALLGPGLVGFISRRRR